jgi:hypothetical protein
MCVCANNPDGRPAPRGTCSIREGLPSSGAAPAQASPTAAGDPKQSLQELVAPDSTSMPRAIGRRVTLAPGPEDIHAINPRRLDGMGGVVNAIAAWSHELYARYRFNECGS